MFDFLFSWLQGPINSKRTNEARQSVTSFLGFPSTPNYADADGPPTDRPSALPASTPDTETEADTEDTQPEDS